MTESKKTILVVDDASLAALSEANVLKKEGYNVITAFSGESAIEKVKNNQIDLILMDVDMGKGKMDGAEAAAVILQDHDIPVVFLSSHTEPEVVSKTEKITSYGYVVKDSVETVLIISIKTAFKLHEAHRKTLERDEALQASEEKYRRIVETTNEGIWLIDKSYTIVFINPRMASMLGYAPEEMIDRSPSDFVHKDELDDHHNRVEKRKRGISEQFERRLICKDGSFLWTIVSAAPIQDKDGNFQGAFAMFTDITKRKQSEEALAKSEERYRFLFDAVPVGILMSDFEGRRYAANLRAQEMTGYTLEELIASPAGNTWVDLNERKQMLQVLSDSGQVRDYEAMLRRKDGTVYYTLMDVKYTEIEGQKLLLTAARDITKLKQAENALRQAEAKYRSIFENAAEGIYQATPEGRFITANPALARIHGYDSPEDLVNSVTDIGTQIFVYPEQRNEIVRLVIEKGLIENRETQVYRKDGTKIWVSVNIRAVRDGSGDVQFIEGTIEDITERKQTEEKLQGERNKIDSIIGAMTSGLTIRDRDYNIIYESPLTLKLFGSHIGEKCYQVFHNRETLCEPCPVELAFQDGKAHKTIREIKKPNGAILYSENISNPIRDPSGKIISCLEINTDITEHRLAEEKIKSLLAEKELLLREVHHRIKNNMNVLMGLLSLQSSTSKDPSTVAALDDAKNRVRSMMVLYDKLYRSGDFRRISTKEYLTSLIHEIVGNFPNRGLITIEEKIDDVILDAKTLSPLGIILNELLTNAMKHAFPDGMLKVRGSKFNAGEAKTITVTLKENHDSEHRTLNIEYRTLPKRVTLMIQDNGVGIPESIDIGSATGFGLQLVGMLTEQLEGNIRLEREKGTRFVLEFDV